MAPKQPPAGKGRAAIPDAGQYATAGLQFTAGMLLFAFAGNWLDGRLGTRPWLVVTGLLLGIVVGFYELIKTTWPR